MKNFYVTYAFEDNEARKNFYGEVKAAGIVGASRAEEGCFRYEFTTRLIRKTKFSFWSSGRTWRSMGNIRKLRIMRFFQSLRRSIM